MFCSQCGKEINDSAKFCSYCGTSTAQIEEKIINKCPDCGKEFDDECSFCDDCGSMLTNAKINSGDTSGVQVPVNQPIIGNGYQPMPFGGNQTQMPLNEMKMMSKYLGIPNVGIAKATGTLRVFPDRIEYEKKLGNAIGGAAGVVGMVIAKSEMEKEGNFEIYPMNTIAAVTRGKYAGVMSTLIISFKNGETFSFAGTTGSKNIDSAVANIRRYI